MTTTTCLTRRATPDEIARMGGMAAPAATEEEIDTLTTTQMRDLLHQMRLANQGYRAVEIDGQNRRVLFGPLTRVLKDRDEMPRLVGTIRETGSEAWTTTAMSIARLDTRWQYATGGGDPCDLTRGADCAECGEEIASAADHRMVQGRKGNWLDLHRTCHLTGAK